MILLDANVLRHVAALDAGYEKILDRLNHVGRENIRLSVIIFYELLVAAVNGLRSRTLAQRFRSRCLRLHGICQSRRSIDPRVAPS